MGFALKDQFEPFDKSLPIKVEKIDIKDFYVDVFLTNAMKPLVTSMNAVKKFFAVDELKGELVDGGQFFRLRIPRVQVPEQGYSIHYLLAELEQNKNKKWVLGLNDYGVQSVDVENLTHVIVAGASGYGKTSFFRYLLAQTLAFHPDAVNFIIDPKQIDYDLYKAHPNVMKVCKNESEWTQIMHALVLEIEIRKHYFNSAFEATPTSLREYLSFREEHSREDLPEFPRIFVWCDEAHMIFNENSSMALSENIREVFKFIARQARAFGIHLIFSSQRGNDIPSIVRAQIPTAMQFFNPLGDSSYLNTRFSDLDSFKAIPGRFCALLGEKKIKNLQAPWITAEESVASSFLLASCKYEAKKGFKYGLRMFDISEPQMLRNKQIVTHALRGNSLDVTSFITLDKSRSNRGDLEDIGILKEVYCSKYVEEQKEENGQKKEASLGELRQDLKATITESKKNTVDEKKHKEEKRRLDAEELLSEFQNAFSPESGSYHLDHKNNGPTNEEGTQSIVLPQIEITDNGVSISDLLAKYQGKINKAKTDFSWCLVDLSRNKGINECYKEMLEHKNELKLDGDQKFVLEDIALSHHNSLLVKKYVEEIQKIKKTSLSGPLLVIYGEAGLGKKTLLKAMSRELSLPMRLSNKSDVLEKISTSFPVDELAPVKHKGSSEGDSKEINEVDELVVFDDLDSALLFSKRPKCNIHPILYIEPNEETKFEQLFFGGDLFLEKVKYISSYNILVKLSKSDYADSEIAEKLIRSLLKRYDFEFSANKEYAVSFASHGVKMDPVHIKSIVERAFYRSRNLDTAFGDTVLEEILNEFSSSEKISEHRAVEVVKAEKSILDLVLNDGNKNRLNELVAYSKSQVSRDYQFIKKIRGDAERLVMLFCGPPGTGKSMSAEVLAKELGRDLWVCSLAKLQSSYVGETEKIMESVFYSAQAAKVVLLIDECDSFLQSRELIKNEYSMRVVNNLLTLIESFKGILILTTNYPENLDKAFSRRIDFKFQMDEPSENEMAEILRKTLMPDAPLEESMDFKKLVEGLSLTGGLIKNAVERAFVKMISQNKEQLSFTMLRESLEETRDENLLVMKSDRKIGLA